MAGVTRGQLPYTPAGTKWDPTRGAYVPVGTPEAGKSAEGSAKTAGNLAPGSTYQTDAAGVSTYGGVAPADAPSSLAGMQNTAAAEAQKRALESEASLTGLRNAASMNELNRSGEIASGSRQQEADLAAAAEARRLGQLPGILAATGGGGSSTPTVAYPTEQVHSAQDLAFARAKDRVAQNARASVNALRSEMAGRGIASAPGAPSGIQENAEAGVLAGGGSDLANTITQQAQDEAAQAANAYQQQYAGGITQRGQDISAKSAALPSILGLIKAGAY